jgi:hypothetical protein
MKPKLALFLVAMLVIGMAASLAQWTYQGCEDVTDADFIHQTIIGIDPTRNPLYLDPSLMEPIKMAFDPAEDAEGNTIANIYFVERRGKLRFYDALQNTLETIGEIEVFTTGTHNHTTGDNIEDGLVGIALDPDFKTNQRIYLYYSTPQPPYYFRVSRFTLVDNNLDLTSEKILLDIPVQQDACCHTGGAMSFDEFGDLWITTGNNAGYFGGSELYRDRKAPVCPVPCPGGTGIQQAGRWLEDIHCFRSTAGVICACGQSRRCFHQQNHHPAVSRILGGMS